MTATPTTPTGTTRTAALRSGSTVFVGGDLASVVQVEVLEVGLYQVTFTNSRGEWVVSAPADRTFDVLWAA